jgi:hypothetical protein
MFKQLIIFQGLYHDNMTIDVRENIHKNLLSFNKEYDLNVPPPLDNILIYRATLGHKANHSFRPNTKFGFAKNPRLIFFDAEIDFHDILYLKFSFLNRKIL